MYRITIRFYEELNDFLSKEMRKKDIDFSFMGKRSVKDLIESMGIPHVEVDLILVNGKSVDFSYIINNEDRISVYPVFETFSIEEVTHLRKSPLRDTKFVLDVHLRKLARRMRLLGLDVDYKADRDDPELAKIAEDENRILLTRDRQLLKRKNVSRGIIIRNTDPEAQILEVLERLDLWSTCEPFTRCIECNGEMSELPINSNNFNKFKRRIPEEVRSWCTEYHQCSSCSKIYWKGTHYKKLDDIVNRIMRSK